MRNEWEMVIPIVLFLSIAVVLYHWIKTRHTEKMAIIDKGLTDQQLAFFKGKREMSLAASDWTAKIAVLLIGVGLAILIGNLFPEDMNEQMITALIFLFPGIGLLIIYRHLEKKAEKKEKA